MVQLLSLIQVSQKGRKASQNGRKARGNVCKKIFCHVCDVLFENKKAYDKHTQDCQAKKRKTEDIQNAKVRLQRTLQLRARWQKVLEKSSIDKNIALRNIQFSFKEEKCIRRTLKLLTTEEAKNYHSFDNQNEDAKEERGSTQKNNKNRKEADLTNLPVSNRTKSIMESVKSVN